MDEGDDDTVELSDEDEVSSKNKKKRFGEFEINEKLLLIVSKSI